MKKNKTIFIVFLVLFLIALVLWLTQSTSTFKRALSDFQLNDSSNVTRIFLADKNNNSVILSRKSPGKWMVNEKYLAQIQSVDLLLKTRHLIFRVV